jgi:DNA-binding response OmpR family regulator
MKVLIAEDQLTDRLALRAAVERLGHECVVAKDGIEAWELFTTCDPDAVISDLRMPRMDGLELCRKIRAESPAHVPFVFTTGLADREHVLAGMEAGADDYLVKPVELGEVRARLIAARWLKRVEDERRERSDQSRGDAVARLVQLRSRLDSGELTDVGVVSAELEQIRRLLEQDTT